MSAKVTRLNKLYPALSAKERAIMRLRAWKQERKEDPLILKTMPWEQEQEFDRYFQLIKRVNIDLAWHVTVVQLLVNELSTRLAWLTTMRLWAMQSAWALESLTYGTREPITRTDYDDLVQKARAELVPVAELAEVLLERHHGWTAADLEPAEVGEEPEATDEAWERVYRDKQREFAHLVRTKVLAGKGRGSRLRVNAGAFYDWLGEEVPVHPGYGYAYEVLPDEEEHLVERLRWEREHVRHLLRRAPLSLAGLDAAEEEGDGERAGADGVAQALLTTMQETVAQRWRELRSSELLLEEATAQLDGEDAADPKLRQTLEDCRAKLLGIHEELRQLGDCQLPDPEQGEVDQLRELLSR